MTTPTEPTALDDDLLDAIETASDVIRCPGWEKRAKAELARLLADSRELARREAGGVWLKRWVGEPTSYGDFLHLCKYTGEWMTYRKSRNPNECDPEAKKPEHDEICYGPLPSEGRDDGEA